MSGCISSFDSMVMALTQSDFLSHDQGYMLGPELNLTEMTEGEYTHLQKFIEIHMEAEAGVSDMPSDGNTGMTKDAVISPLSNTQAIDLSTSSDGHRVVLPGEKTPLCFGEVPEFVLAKIREEHTAPSNSSSFPSRAPSTARVCLEKRFNSMPGTLGHQDNQSAVLSKFVTVVQQPSEAQDAHAHAHLQRWIRNDRRNNMSNSFIGIYNPVNNICRQFQVISPNPHQSLVIPKGLPLNVCPENVLAKKTFESTNSTSGEIKIKSLPAKSVQLRAKSKASKGTSDLPQKNIDKKQGLRRETHNSRERERRKKIRLCCDELNMLVPFCQTDTDKVTTLRWTAAYLKYINKMYGDMLKVEFQKMFTDSDELKPNPSSVTELILHNTDNVPMAAEP